MTALAHPDHPAHRAPEHPVNKLDRLLHVARTQVGYHEGRSHGHWNNIEKYAGQVPGLAWANGQAWCAVFASWCYLRAGLAAPSEVPTAGASCDAQAAKWKHMRRWSEYPVVGGQIFYGTPRDLVHTGIVVGYDDQHVYTIEGNTNVSGSREGDGVYLKRHERRSAHVVGYGVPHLGTPLQTPDPKLRGRL